MIKIVGLDIVDILPFSSGVLFVLKEKNKNEKLSYYCFDIPTQSISPATKNAYLLTKFGSCFTDIASRLEDTVSCDTAKLWNGQTFVNYSSGEFGLFDEKGVLINTGDISYNGSPARDAAEDDTCIWSVVPEQNLIIKYSTAKKRVMMRIGGAVNSPFASPCSVDRYGDLLYVCNPSAKKINKIDLRDFSVEDYRKFTEPVYKYIAVNGFEFAVLASGVYML